MISTYFNMCWFYMCFWFYFYVNTSQSWDLCAGFQHGQNPQAMVGGSPAHCLSILGTMMFCKFGKISEHFEWCEEQIIDWKLLPRNVMGFAEENVLPEHQWNSPRLGSAPQASCNQHRAQCRYQLATPFMVAEHHWKAVPKQKSPHC